jgi:hypothetical protein
MTRNAQIILGNVDLEAREGDVKVTLRLILGGWGGRTCSGLWQASVLAVMKIQVLLL